MLFCDGISSIVRFLLSQNVKYEKLALYAKQIFFIISYVKTNGESRVETVHITLN